MNVLGTRATAEMLNLRTPVDPALLSKLATGPEAAFALTQCRSDILADALVIQLNQLDKTNIATDDQAWSDAVKRTQALVAHTERCAPGNGDLWLRDAMLIRAVAEEPDAIVKRLALSANLTSSYMPVVQTRVALWASLQPASQEAGKDVIDDDLRIMVFYFPPYQTAAMIKSLPDHLRKRAMSFVPLAPQEHRLRLETALAAS